MSRPANPPAIGTAISVTGSMSEMMEAWLLYREQIPVEERDKVADIIFDPSIDTTSPVGLNQLLIKVMRATLTGQLPPVVLSTVESMMQLLALNIHNMHRVSGTEHLARRDVFVVAQEVLRDAKPLQPRYLTHREIQPETPLRASDLAPVDEDKVADG